MNLHNKRVVVMGLGRFGGGAGVTRFCIERGAHVLLTDQTSEADLAAGLALIQDLLPDSNQLNQLNQSAQSDSNQPSAKLTLRLGEHREEDFTAADVLVVNPAVKPDNPFVAAAIAAGVRVTSEIRLLVSLLPDRAKTIAITGSAGKSTTTAMTGHVLAKALGSKHVHVGGNLGGSLLGQLDQIKNDDWVILELSSFMLQGLREDQWSPHIAVVTSYAHNHLDWHGSEPHYRSAKQAIFDFQQPGDIAILSPDCQTHFTPAVTDIRIAPPAADWQGQLLVPGSHNKANAQLAAAIVSAAIDQPVKTTADALFDFPGLPHRLQYICEHADVRFYNDSKATTPEAAKLAIDSFEPHTVHVILGGYDKQSDMTALAQHAAARCVAVYTIGDTGHTIAKAARANTGDQSQAHSQAQQQATQQQAKVHECKTLENAVKLAIANVCRGDVVLLSPGCASWDQFENYEQRGQSFAMFAISHTGEGSPNPPMRK